ncbi:MULTISPECIES: cobalamin-independent methionine synthase II family protein [Enterobacter cloacae complex]|uniref:cobalamin-independent methionine synthase II family protein n=1 Tax=Enterobacter cloacae complex TaxID=354276 RepID=UPI0028126ABB|nr:MULTISPECIES: cobalamin-independent methionine synthase II family protein [Enterobacter cloacae complex]
MSADIRDAVIEIVRKQAEVGIDIVSDGETNKIGYATYVKDRLSGFDGSGSGIAIADLHDVPEFAAHALKGLDVAMPACTGPISYRGEDAVNEDISNLKAATQKVSATDAFISAASPGVISIFLENQFYPSEDAYIEALAEGMRPELEAIHEAGFLLQIDSPDLAMGRHVGHKVLEVGEFRKQVAKRVEIINHATRNIPADRLRVHLCWGNYEGPHNHDVPLTDIVDLIFGLRAQALLFEGANPRHAHEWRVFEEVTIPQDKVLVPGVIDTCTNYVEHPELVAERIVRFANIVGRERVIAGTDCGFATFANFLPVDPKIAWLKLKSLTDGAALATKELWSS